MRKLKYHEKKVLKKVNFLEWKRERGHLENLITGRYHMGGRDDYKKFVTFFFVFCSLSDETEWFSDSLVLFWGGFIQIFRIE